MEEENNLQLEFDTQLNTKDAHKIGEKSEKIKRNSQYNILLLYINLTEHEQLQHRQKNISDPSVNYSNHTYNRTLCG